jgi:hypothetical protein
MKERIPMSEKDIKRLRILTEVKEGKTKQSKAAKILGITPRQVIGCPGLIIDNPTGRATISAN